MSEGDRPKTPRKAPEKGAKSARLAEALRLNLARRKAQKRARDAEATAGKEQG